MSHILEFKWLLKLFLKLRLLQSLLIYWGSLKENISFFKNCRMSHIVNLIQVTLFILGRLLFHHPTLVRNNVVLGELKSVSKSVLKLLRGRVLSVLGRLKVFDASINGFSGKWPQNSATFVKVTVELADPVIDTPIDVLVLRLMRQEPFSKGTLIDRRSIGGAPLQSFRVVKPVLTDQPLQIQFLGALRLKSERALVELVLVCHWDKLVGHPGVKKNGSLRSTF